MQGRRAFATVLLALTLLGLGWVSAAASSADGGGFSQGEIELEGVTPDSGTNSFVAGGLTVTPTVEVTHPVGLALATYFDVDPAEIMCRHEQGIGFGSIAKAYFLADILAEDSVTETVEAILDQKMLGAGWGQIFQSYDLSPSSKGRNLGSVMSGRARPPLTPTLAVRQADRQGLLSEDRSNWTDLDGGADGSHERAIAVQGDRRWCSSGSNGRIICPVGAEAHDRLA